MSYFYKALFPVVAVIKSKCCMKISVPQDGDGDIQSDYKVVEVMHCVNRYRYFISVLFKNEMKMHFFELMCIIFHVSTKVLGREYSLSCLVLSIQEMVIVRCFFWSMGV